MKVRGLRNSEIAQRLVLSPKTVGQHVSAILAKLDASGRGEASAKAIELGIVPSPGDEQGALWRGRVVRAGVDDGEGGIRTRDGV